MASAVTPDCETYPPQTREPSFLDFSTEDADSRGLDQGQIPDPDRGFAWIFLAAAFVIEFLAWGFNFSSGILVEYWNANLFPNSPSVIIALAATIQGGVLYASAIFLQPLFRRFPEHRAKIQYAGLLLSVAGIIGTAFVTAPWQLILTSGVLYAAGAGTVYLPAAMLVFEWFAQKRGLAAAIVYSGTGVGGTVIPLVMRALLDRFSYRAAVLALGLSYGLLGTIAIYFIRERIPVHRMKEGMRRRHENYRAQPRMPFLRRGTFYAFLATVFLTSCGNFLPTLEIPTYASTIGLSQTSGTVLLSVMNAASVAGLLLFGSLSDRWPLKTVIALSCIGSSLACFVLWGFGTSLGVLLAFSTLWGIFGLSFTSLWTRMIVTVSGDDPSMPPQVLAIFGLFRGIGSVLSGPVSSSLISSGKDMDLHRDLYGVHGYGPLLIYTGSVLALGGITGVLWKA